MVRTAAIAGQWLIALEYGATVLFRGLDALSGGPGAVIAAGGMIVPAFLAWVFIRRARVVRRRYDREAFRGLRTLNVVVSVVMGIGAAATLATMPSLVLFSAVDIAIVVGATVAAEAAARVLPSGAGA
jgi:hypothetical protein